MPIIAASRARELASETDAMYRTYVILRHTFVECILQPIYSVLLALGSAAIVIFMLLPFFTLSEDTLMFKSVGLDIVLLLVLLLTLFATSKSIFDEIEDRTMLTLMSKPLKKWEVLLGKYLGIVAAAALATAVLGLVLVLATWWRVPTDYMISNRSLDERELETIRSWRMMHAAGLVAALVLKWLQVCVLAAVSVAISTRVSLVVNLPVVIFMYIAGNLSRFFFPLRSDDGFLTKALAWIVATVLPYLENFDLTSKTVYEKLAVAEFAKDPTTTRLLEVWAYVGSASLYAASYIFFALVIGLILFHNRELGGAEG